MATKFVTDDGYTLELIDGVWTDGDLTFRDVGGRPVSEACEDSEIPGEFLPGHLVGDPMKAHLKALPAGMDFDAQRDELVFHFGISRGEANAVVEGYERPGFKYCPDCRCGSDQEYPLTAVVCEYCGAELVEFAE